MAKVTKEESGVYELKPCPFCGAELVRKEEVWRQRITNVTRKFTVYTHPGKGCVLDMHRFHFYNSPEKVAQWNRRVSDEQQNI